METEISFTCNTHLSMLNSKNCQRLCVFLEMRSLQFCKEIIFAIVYLYRALASVISVTCVVI